MGSPVSRRPTLRGQRPLQPTSPPLNQQQPRPTCGSNVHPHRHHFAAPLGRGRHARHTFHGHSLPPLMLHPHFFPRLPDRLPELPTTFPSWATRPLHSSPPPSPNFTPSTTFASLPGHLDPFRATRPLPPPPPPSSTNTSTATHVTCHGRQVPGHSCPPYNRPTRPRQPSHRAVARNPAGRTPPPALQCQGPAGCPRRFAPGSPAWCAPFSESPDGYWDSCAF